MRKTILTFLIGFAVTAASDKVAHAEDTCLPWGISAEEMRAFVTDGSKPANIKNDNDLSVALLNCLKDPDPNYRDKIGYEALTKLLRDDRVSNSTKQKLADQLMVMMKSTDTEGVAAPFAALVLSEVARADRINPFFSNKERTEIVQASVDYLTELEDYRGFDEEQGWRHGVAHAADLMMQLALNEKIDASQLALLRDAIVIKVIPTKEHFYIYGEPDRLARPILFIAQRGAFTEEEWRLWFENLSSPDPFSSWGEVFFSQEGLARRHNLRAFAKTIYLNATASANPNVQMLREPALQILRITS